MKKLNNCEVQNCIPTSASCIEWNGGDIEFLGICNGDPLTNLVWEVVGKLQDIAGEDLSHFDIDSLLSVCNKKAPQEITLLSILGVVRENQVCMKDFLDHLSQQLADLSNERAVNINLKCYQDFDNLGNALGITRDTLDQLVIDGLCAHKGRIETLEGKATSLQAQVNAINAVKTVAEPEFTTCVDGGTKPTSAQVISVANAHCALETAIGTPAEIAQAISVVPAAWNQKFGHLTGWIAQPSSLVDYINNMFILAAFTEARVTDIEDNCCAPKCDDVKLGFSALFNEDMDGLILKFTSGAGTSIPAGFTDKGTTGTITDADGNVETFTAKLANNYEVEVPVSGLNLQGDLTINLQAAMGNQTTTCQKCLGKTVKPAPACAVCEISSTGTGSVVIIYEDDTMAYTTNS